MLKSELCLARRHADWLLTQAAVLIRVGRLGSGSVFRLLSSTLGSVSDFLVNWTCPHLEDFRALSFIQLQEKKKNVFVEAKRTWTVLIVFSQGPAL